jgi:hypothetical protein
LLIGLSFLRNTWTPAASDALSFDGDAALHVVLGQRMIERGGWLDTEPTTRWVVDGPFIAHEWLTELMFAGAWWAWGPAGPVLWMALVIAVLLAVLWRHVREAATPWPATLAVLGALVVLQGHLHARPHVVTWLGVALLGLWSAWAKRTQAGLGRRVAPLIVLMVVWAQLHAGFLVAFPLLFAELGGAAVRAVGDPVAHRFRGVAGWASALVAALLATAVNPWGFALHAHFLSWMADPYLMRFTTEFNPPDVAGVAGKVLYGWGAFVVLGAALRGRPHAPEDVFRGLGTAYLALSSARHGAVFALATAPFAAACWTDALRVSRSGWWERLRVGVVASDSRLEDAEAGAGVLRPVGVVVAVVIAAQSLMHWPRIDFDPKQQPVEAAAWVAEHPEATAGPMFNPFRWGAYLAMTLPDKPLYVNSWHDHLGPERIRRYRTVEEGAPDWERVLEEDGVAWVIHEKRSSLSARLRRSEGWKEVHRDGAASVFVRQGNDGHMPQPGSNP